MTLKVDAPKKIPRYLIYEKDEGKPIYYRWYKEYLNGNESYEETIPGDSLQSWLKNQLSFLITHLLQGNRRYVVTVGEQGFSLK